MVCVADENYEAMLRHYAHVLVGRVDSRSETASGPEFRLSSIRVWKGDKKSIVLRNTNGTCGKYPALGRVYLVFAASDPQDVTMCSPVMIERAPSQRRRTMKADEPAFTRMARSRCLSRCSTDRRSR